MSKNKDISATEKLLEMIRGEDENATFPPVKSSEPFKPDISISIDEDLSLPPLSLELETESKSTQTARPSTYDDDYDIDVRKVPEKKSNEGAETPFSAFPAGQKKPIPDNFSDNANDISQAQERKPFPIQLPNFNISTKAQIGIAIRPDCINFAKLSKNSTEPKLSNYLAVSIPASESGEESAEILFQRPDFIETLSTNLDSFCRDIKKPEIWCSFYSERVQILNIIIPKVPQGEIANAIFWSTKKEFEFDPAEYIYDYSIIKEIEVGKITKFISIVYLFPRNEVNAVKSTFKKLGYPLTGITHRSAAINNFFQHNVLETGESPCVHLHFEKLSSFIDIYYKGAMLFTREIKTGVNSYAEAILELGAKDNIILDDQSAISLAFNSTKEVISRQKGAKNHLQATRVNNSVDIKNLPVTGRLIRQLSRTFDFCATSFKVPRATRLFNSGFLTLKDDVLREIKTELDIDCAVVDVFKNDNENIDRKEHTLNFPETLNPLTAFGLTLSNKAITPNILFTFADKKKQLQENKVNQIISILTIFLAISIGTVFFFQYQSISNKEQILSTLTAELEQKYNEDPRSRDNNFALMATKKISDTIKDTSERANQFAIIALVLDVTSLVPKEMKLTDLQIDTGRSNKDEKTESNNMPVKPVMSLEGFVSGEETSQNFRLLNFQKSLNQVALVDEAHIFSRKDTIYNEGKLLYFTMEIDLQKGLFQ